MNSSIRTIDNKKHSSVKDFSVTGNKKKTKADSPDHQSHSPSNFDDTDTNNNNNNNKVIDGIEIQALAIKQEDLKRFHTINNEETNSNLKFLKEQEILVKKINKNYFPTKEYKVAKLLASSSSNNVNNTKLKPIDTSINKGIKFDTIGDVLPYSILGSIEDYLREARLRGTKIEAPFDDINDDCIPIVGVYNERSKSSSLSNKNVIDTNGGSHALMNWQHKMYERKRIQGHISKLIKRATNELVMNQSEQMRQSNEIKTLIDRTMPLLNYGKGNRLNSEFWTQATTLGNTQTGIHTTLNKTESGHAPPIEIISKPNVILNETNLNIKQQHSHYNNNCWQKSKYLQHRVNVLQPFIKELLPHYPDTSQLQIIGYNNNNSQQNSNETHKNTINDTWINTDILYKSSIVVVDDVYAQQQHQQHQQQYQNDHQQQDNEQQLNRDKNPLSEHDDVISQPIFGPALIFGGQMAKWTGNTNENAGLVALESRLNFETKANKRVSATFEIFNCGTTSVYYDWRRLPDSNPFDIVNSKTQRFYFDTRSSSILPGDMLKVHFIFKSHKGGLFTEKWEFLASPRLLSGASLILTLRGIAIQEDKFKKTRTNIEQKLLINEAEKAAKEAIEMILMGVRTPERASSPEDAYLTDEQLFCKLNSNFYYVYETIEQIKEIYKEYVQEVYNMNMTWNLSIDDFKNDLMKLPESNEKKQELLSRLNANINSIAFNTYKPNESNAYNICYSLLIQTIDCVVDEIVNVKLILGLNSANSIDETYPTNINDKITNDYEIWKKEFELFKQQELERKNKIEKDKSKDKSKKGGVGGGTGTDKKDEKIKKEVDAKKKPTPTPSTASKTKPPPPKSPLQVDKIETRQTSAREMSSDQKKIHDIYLNKIHVMIYQQLADMVDRMDALLHDSYKNIDVVQMLGQVITQPKLIEAKFSDYID